MKICIEIPDAFIEHFKNDKFKDSIGRICYDIENAVKTQDGVSGRYEWELVEMLADAFSKSESVEEEKDQAIIELKAKVKELNEENAKLKKEVDSSRWQSSIDNGCVMGC